MKDKLPQPQVWQDEATTLLPFPNNSAAFPAVPLLLNAPPTPESLLQDFPLTLAHITAAPYNINIKYQHVDRFVDPPE